MTKKEFAEEVAKLYGEDANVSEVSKNGVTFTAVSVKRTETIAANYYIDDDFEKDFTPEETCEKLRKVIKLSKEEGEFEVEKTAELIKNFEEAKELLALRLYNVKAKDSYQICRSAESYGFDDLILVPMVKGKEWSCVVSEAILKGWGITEDELFDICINNVKDNVVVRSIKEVLMDLMNIESEEEAEKAGLEESPMYVISNADGSYGAVATLFAKENLDELFPNGYAILPSSIHETIAVPIPDEVGIYDSMVNDVNDTQVAAEEILGNKAYLFKK